MNWSQLKCQDLYVLCLRGDEAAWGYLYNYILKISAALGGPKNDGARDEAHSIVVKLLNRGLQRVNRPQAFRAYVRTAIQNHFKDKWRCRSPRTTSLTAGDPKDGSGALDLPSSYPDPDAIMGGKSLYELVDAHLAQLSRECRQLLETYVAYKTNRYPGRYPDYKTIARKLNLPQGTLASRIKRCLDQLRAFPKIRDWLETKTSPVVLPTG